MRFLMQAKLLDPKKVEDSGVKCGTYMWSTPSGMRLMETFVVTIMSLGLRRYPIYVRLVEKHTLYLPGPFPVRDVFLV